MRRKEYSTISESSNGHKMHSELKNSPNRGQSKQTPNVKCSVCTICRRGPFRSLRIHMRHCTGAPMKYQCSLCENHFVSEAALQEHYMPLYACHVCGQIFPQEILYRHHSCPKDSRSPYVIYCSDYRPKACNICKSFFTSQKALLNHVTKVHTSVVSTKICIVTNTSALKSKTFLPVDTAQSEVTHSSLTPLSISNPSSSPSDIHLDTSSMLTADLSGVKPDNQPQNHAATPAIAPSTANESMDPAPPPDLSIVAIFKNKSDDVAFMKRMNTGWRAKIPYSCRHCGAISRQLSFIISHRYLHRGSGAHRCHCGRTFKHRLHLLRHCLLHAEALSYICAGCGETFFGARLLAEHMNGKTQTGRTTECKVKKKCRMPFTCDCGQVFMRPSAFIWHQIQNWTRSGHYKKRMNGRMPNYYR